MDMKLMNFRILLRKRRATCDVYSVSEFFVYQKYKQRVIKEGGIVNNDIGNDPTPTAMDTLEPAAKRIKIEGSELRGVGKVAGADADDTLKDKDTPDVAAAKAFLRERINKLIAQREKEDEEEDDDDESEGSEESDEGDSNGEDSSEDEDEDDEDEEEDEEEESDEANSEEESEDDDSEEEEDAPTLNERQQALLSFMDAKQTVRYEFFRRTNLGAASIKKLVSAAIGGNVNVPTDFARLLAGVGKVFVGEVVEAAREAQRTDGSARTALQLAYKRDLAAWERRSVNIGATNDEDAGPRPVLPSFYEALLQSTHGVSNVAARRLAASVAQADSSAFKVIPCAENNNNSEESSSTAETELRPDHVLRGWRQVSAAQRRAHWSSPCQSSQQRPWRRAGAAPGGGGRF
jgi:hypothetical protein